MDPAVLEQTAAARARMVREPHETDPYVEMLHALWQPDRRAATRYGLQCVVLEPSNPVHVSNALTALAETGRAGEIPNWVQRTPKPIAPAERHTVDLPPLVQLYRRLLVETDRRRAEGWTPSSIEAVKFEMPLTVENLADFRRSEVSSGTQTVPERPSDFPPLDFSTFYPDVSDREKEQWIPSLGQTRGGLLMRLYKAATRVPDNPARRHVIDLADALMLDDDRFGARLFDLPGIGPVTAKSLQAMYYACRLISLTPVQGTILEIGGGFGAVASRVLRVRPDVTYILTDLPMNLILTYAYLRSHFGDAVYGAFEGPLAVPQGCRVLVVPPWRLKEFSGRASVVFNSMSFQHMDKRNHAYYGDVMRHFEARRLYHVNRQEPIPDDRTMEVPARDYSFLSQFDIREETPFDKRWIEVVADRKREP